MYKLMLVLFAACVLLSNVSAKPQVLLDYGYYAPLSYSYSAPLAYSYPYAYTYGYPYYI